MGFGSPPPAEGGKFSPPSIARAMVFAAGKGERLGPLTARRAKPALPLCGVPLLTRVFRWLAAGGIGFLGLLVVLLSTMRPFWIPLITFVFSALLAGSTRLRVSLQLDSSLAGVLQGTLVLIFILFQGLRQRLEARSSQNGAEDAQGTGGQRGLAG